MRPSMSSAQGNPIELADIVIRWEDASLVNEAMDPCFRLARHRQTWQCIQTVAGEGQMGVVARLAKIAFSVLLRPVTICVRTA